MCNADYVLYRTQTSSEHQGQHPCWRWEGGAGEQDVFLLAGENLVVSLPSELNPVPLSAVFVLNCMCVKRLLAWSC